jgi:hypothetical protein
MLTELAWHRQRWNSLSPIDRPIPSLRSIDRLPLLIGRLILPGANHDNRFEFSVRKTSDPRT